jgi:hypothetical protein
MALSQIRVRPAVFADAPSIVDVDAAAFSATALESYLYPGKEAFPADTLRHKLVQTKIRLSSPAYHAFVAVVDKDGEEKVVGAALWRRRGSSKAARRWQGDSIANREWSSFSCVLGFSKTLLS